MTANRHLSGSNNRIGFVHSTASIIAVALVGALLGVGVWLLIASHGVKRPEPNTCAAPNNAIGVAAARSEVIREVHLIGAPSPRASRSHATTLPIKKRALGPAISPHRSVVICVDPGHPSEVSAGQAVQNGLQEVVVNWRVAAYLAKSLQARGYSVVLTRRRLDALVTNRRRAEIANQCGASLLLRLHCDTGSGSGCTLYYPDRQGKKNAKVGPSLSVIRASALAAEAIHCGMTAALRGALRDNGVKGDSATRVGRLQGALTGSIYSRVPAVTVEMVFLSNKTDADFVRNARGQQQIASALAAGIAQYLPITQGKAPEEARSVR